MSFFSELADLALFELQSDYKVKNPHRGWVVLSMFGTTSESDVESFWKYQRGCEEGESIDRFLSQYKGRVELALVPAEAVGLAYQDLPQLNKNVLVMRPVMCQARTFT